MITFGCDPEKDRPEIPQRGHIYDPETNSIVTTGCCGGIKFPVRVVPDDFAIEVAQGDYAPGFFVLDSVDNKLAENEKKSVADYIALALNVAANNPEIMVDGFDLYEWLAQKTYQLDAE